MFFDKNYDTIKIELVINGGIIMEKIIVLGTGTASVVENFNTCFVLEDNNGEYLLVDTGGGNGILRQFKRANIDLSKIHNIFISHKHIDHLYGMLWIYRFVDISMQKGTYDGDLNIYCHDEVAKILRDQVHTLLRKSQQQFIDKRIFINVVNDHEKVKVLNYDLEFLDIISKSDKQYGFKTTLNSGKTLAFLGDEPLDEKLFDDVRNIDYLLHESFCLETESEKYKPKEKNHDTVKSASIKAQTIGAKNLVLWHTQENLGENRKEKYIEEAKENFFGNVYVPNDLDIIELF